MAHKRSPNYGPGSVSTQAKTRVAKLQQKPKASLRDLLSPDAQQIQDRTTQQKALKKEVGGRR
jgi:hypothetical protein